MLLTRILISAVRFEGGHVILAARSEIVKRDFHLHRHNIIMRDLCTVQRWAPQVFKFTVRFRDGHVKLRTASEIGLSIFYGCCLVQR